MPGAGHHTAIHNPLPERPAPMQAGVVDCVEFAPHIGNRNRLAFHVKLPDRSRRDFIRLRCPRKRHPFLPTPPLPPMPVVLVNPLQYQFCFPFTLVPASAPPSRPF